MSSILANHGLSIGDKRLEGRILIEHQEPVADIGVGNGAKLEHFLYQRTGFYRVVGIHLLKGREITGGKISAFQSVVALHRYRGTASASSFGLNLNSQAELRSTNC